MATRFLGAHKKLGRYVTLAHERSKPSEQRMGLLYGWASRIKTDGLNSLKYKRLDMKFNKLYTWILVDLREPKMTLNCGRTYRHWVKTTPLTELTSVGRRVNFADLQGTTDDALMISEPFHL
ncbi:hypothetical protein MTO96_023684 [Rhipicephalus appendiculatus]